MRIVLVDDEKVICDGLRKLLTSRGSGDLVVDAIFYDSEEALEFCDWDKVDLALVDINMPGITGLEMIEKLRDRGFETLVIIITGHDDFEHARRAIRDNVVDFLLKPVVPEMLFEAIDKAARLLGERKKLRESHLFIERNRKKLIREFLGGLMFGTRQIDTKEIESAVSLLGLERKKFAVAELISALGRQEIDAAIHAAQHTDDAEAYLYTSGSGLYTVLLVRDRESEYDIEAIKLHLSPIGKEILWSELKYTNHIEDLEGLHGLLMEHLRRKVKPAVRAAASSAMPASEFPDTKSEYSIPVQKAVTHIHNHFPSPLSLHILSEVVNVHPTYLSNLFKKQTGYALIDYINHFRIEQAKKILRDPLAKIYWVAERVGFVNQRYFSHVFKKCTGTTPVQYRSNCFLDNTNVGTEE